MSNPFLKFAKPSQTAASNPFLRFAKTPLKPAAAAPVKSNPWNTPLKNDWTKTQPMSKASAFPADPLRLNIPTGTDNAGSTPAVDTQASNIVSKVWDWKVKGDEKVYAKRLDDKIKLLKDKKTQEAYKRIRGVDLSKMSDEGIKLEAASQLEKEDKLANFVIGATEPLKAVGAIGKALKGAGAGARVTKDDLLQEAREYPNGGNFSYIANKKYGISSKQGIDIWNQANKKPAGAGEISVPSTRSEKPMAVSGRIETPIQATPKGKNIVINQKQPVQVSTTQSPILRGQTTPEGEGMKLKQGSSQSLKIQYNNKVKNAMTKVVEYVQNTDERVRQLVNRKDVKITDKSDPYLKMTLYPGRIAIKVETAKGEIENILSEAQKSKVTRKEISEYLIARHAPERNAALGDNAAGITTAEAQARIKAFEASGNGGKIKELADRVQKVSSQTLDILKESGVISDELHAKLRTKYKNHVPLNRIFESTDDIGQALSGKGFNVRSTGIKSAKGSDLDVSDIMENVVVNYEQAVLRSEKNIVDQATLAFARDNKDILGELMDVVKPKAIGKDFGGKLLMEKTNDPSILQLYENGKPIWIKINDKNLAVSLQGVGKEKLPGLLKVVGSFTRLYSSLATRFNPEFAIPNKIRDLQETTVYLASQGKMNANALVKANIRDSASVKDIFDYLRGKDTPGTRLYKEMKDAGGTTGGFGLSTRKNVEISLAKLETLAKSKTKRSINNLVQYVDDWNTIFEDSTRLTVYKTAIEKGLSKERAAAMAKEASINFNRMGKGGPVINALYMFSNASIQGSAKMLQSLRNPKVLGALTLAVGGSVAAVNKFNDTADKDWRDKVSKWDRLNGLPVVVPTTDGSFKYFTIPVSWGIKPIKVMADYADDAISGKGFNAVDMAKNTFTAILDAYNPVGGTDLLSAATPTIGDMPVEIARNKSWSGNQIKPVPYDKNTPADLQYFKSLKETKEGQTAISLTEFLQQKTGIEVSPADVKYAYEQMVGGAGRTVNKVTNLISGVVSGKGIPLDEYPMLSRFYRERTSEEVGAGAGGETENIKKILEKQSREKFEFNQNAEESYAKIKALPDKAQKKQFLLNLAKENEPLARKVIDIAKDEKLNLTYQDRMIKQLGVENGERGKYIKEKLKELKTKEEKKSWLLELARKKILTKEVLEMIKK